MLHIAWPRGMNPYIPEYPVGTPDEIASMIDDFADIARILLGLRKLKIFTFGPRPQISSPAMHQSSPCLI